VRRCSEARAYALSPSQVSSPRVSVLWLTRHGSAHGSRDTTPRHMEWAIHSRRVHCITCCAESRCAASRARCSQLRRAMQRVLFGGIAELHQSRGVCLVQDALMHHRTAGPRAAAHLAHLKACLSRDNSCDARLAIIIVDVALAIAHAGARALSDRLSTHARGSPHARSEHTRTCTRLASHVEVTQPSLCMSPGVRACAKSMQRVARGGSETRAHSVVE